MAVTILNDCINCAACALECPNDAIYGPGKEPEKEYKMLLPVVRDYFFIVPFKCGDCESSFRIPPCMLICPMNCIIKTAEAFN